MRCFNLQLTSDNDIDWSELPIDLDVDDDTQPIIETDIADIFNGEYSSEFVYNVSFPNTYKNYKILGGILSGQGYKLERKEYNIFAVYNGEILKVDKMYAIRNGFNNDGRFEVQLFNSQNWAKAASEKKINTINVFGPYTHLRGNMDAINALGPKFEDGGIPIRYPFVTRNVVPAANASQSFNYYFVESDFVPYVSLWRVLQKGFLEIGWKFECPFLESDYGRRIWVDLLKDDLPQTFSRKPFLLENGFAFYSSSGSAYDRYLVKYQMFGNIKNFTIVDKKPVKIAGGNREFQESITPDPNNDYYANGVYNEAVALDMNLSMRIKRVSPSWKIFQGSVFIYILLGGNRHSYYEYYVAGGEETAVDIDLIDININERDSMTVEIGLWPDLNKDGFIQITDIKLAETKLHRRFLQKGAVYTLNEMFNDDSLMDLLKGVSQMIYGKIDKNDEKRTIRLLSPYDVTLGEDELEGYHKPETSELKNIQRVDINQNDLEKKRYLQLSFKDTLEQLIKDLYPDNEKAIKQYSLHGLFVDFGEQYEKSVETVQNTYFTPTFSPTKGSRVFNAVAGYETGTYINKGRRVVFAIGDEQLQTNNHQDGGIIKVRFWSKDGEWRNPFWAHQSFNEEFFKPLAITFLHLSFSTMKIRPDYEDVYKNLYEVFIKDYILTMITSVSGTVWRYLPSSEFSKFDKRKQYHFSIKDKDIVCEITEIDGYRPCDNVAMAMRFVIGDKFRLPPKYTSTPPEFDRPFDENYDFDINIEKVDCKYYILDLGSRTAQYQYIDETEWNDYTEDGIDARITFTIRVIDDIGDSDIGDSDIVATRLVQTCGDEYPAFIEFEVIDNGVERKFRPFVTGIPSIDIDNIEWMIYQDDEGDSDLDFGDSDLIETEADIVCASAIVNFICGCDPMILSQVCYRFAGTSTECSELGLEMELEDGCWKPIRTGEIKCCVQLDLILWKISEDDVWSVLREPIETICGNTVWFKRVVTFTNGCPNIAIEINSDGS